MIYKYFDPERDPLIVGISPQMMSRLDEARGHAGIPFILTSGLRTGTHNADLKGAVKDSAHLADETGYAHAVDLAVFDDSALFCMVLGLIKAGFRRIGIYATTCADNPARLIPRHLHVDDDSSKPLDVIWLHIEEN